MDKVTTLDNDLLSRCVRILSAGGRLTTAIDGFTARPSQIKLASAIAEVMAQQKTLVAEAGTGTGKTYAYLVPALLSGKKIIISTATKTLQDQLFSKDLPTLIRALGLSVRVQNLKGRSNYLCRYRVQLHAEEGRFLSASLASDVVFIREKLALLTYGECRELPEIAEDSAVWPLVTSTTDNCLNSECPHHQTCFLVKARQRALEADVVIINHHLYFADACLKKEGFGELLPGVDLVVFDEAHHLADIAANFYGQRLSTRQLRELMNDILREWPVLDLASQPLKQLSVALDKLHERLVFALLPEKERFSWQRIENQPTFKQAWQALLTFIKDVLVCFESIDKLAYPGLLRCKARLEAIDSAFNDFDKPQSVKKIRWVERFKYHVVFHATPYDIGPTFNEQRSTHPCAYVFTSATLTVADSFASFTNQLGLVDTVNLQLPSPFNFSTQALLYLPRGLPDTKHSLYDEVLLERAIPIINACKGRCFFLFTSHRALRWMANHLPRHITFPLLIQGEESKPILLERFRQLGHAVLLGTSTFWEGVDVKGEALSCVIIDKLPFESPTDPVICGKMAHLRQQGLSGFDELSLPKATLTLKQGVGRLIRDVTDRGVLMIADPRLTGRAYGEQILKSLPSMKKTRDEETTLMFIKQLTLSYEPTSN